MNKIQPAFNSSFRIPRSSFQNLAGLQRPEDEVEFVEVDAEVVREAAQALLRREVAGARRGRLRRVDDSDFREATEYVLVEYRVAAVADVAQEVARLLVAQPLYLARAREPVAPLDGVSETFEPLAQAHPAVGLQVGARHDDVARARVRVAVS